MFKNAASQSVTLYAVDATTGLPKAGDSANMLFYVSKDDGTVTVIAAASGVPTEVDATNAKGTYKIALAQAETNGDKLLFSGKSSTANVVVVPTVIYTIPASWTIPVVTLVNTVTTYTGNTPQTGDCFTRIGAPAGASIAADLAEIESETDGIAAIPTNPYTGTPPTVAAIATAVWQDATAGDFTVASSIGKSLFTGGVVPGAAGGVFIAGANAATTVTITGSLSGAVGSVTAGVTVAAGAITDASFTPPADAVGQVTGMMSMLKYLYNHFFGKVVYDKVGGTVKDFQADGVTVRANRVVVSNSTTDSTGAAT